MSPEFETLNPLMLGVQLPYHLREACAEIRSIAERLGFPEVWERRNSDSKTAWLTPVTILAERCRRYTLRLLRDFVDGHSGSGEVPGQLRG